MQSVDLGGGPQPAPRLPPLPQRIAELADLPIGDLRDAWMAAWEALPPKGARRRLLMLGIAWKWQAAAQGGPSRQLARRLAALEAGLRTRGTVGVPPSNDVVTPRLLPGTRLIRVWQGEQHEVIVTETGYLWRGRSWGSLSAIARTITGSRRNGPAFFGLRERRTT